jgi:hypothetical protein
MSIDVMDEFFGFVKSVMQIPSKPSTFGTLKFEMRKRPCSYSLVLVNGPDSRFSCFSVAYHPRERDMLILQHAHDL